MQDENTIMKYAWIKFFTRLGDYDHSELIITDELV